MASTLLPRVPSEPPTDAGSPGERLQRASTMLAPALVRRFVEARDRGDASVVIWGTGRPRREFLHVDDLADACFFLLENYDDGAPINVGVGKDISIRELAELIAETVGFSGTIEHDLGKPDGTPRKILDVSRLTALGWQARIPLRDGLAATVAEYVTAAH